MKPFHETHTCSDTVPKLPFQIPGTTHTWPIKYGSPIDWKECWEKLAWRFPRAHMPATTTNTTMQPRDADMPATIANNAAQQHDAQQPTGQRLTANELMLANRMSGVDTSRAQLAAAVTEQRIATVAGSLAPCLGGVVEGGLYFVTLAEGVSEGEFRVSLARAMESKSSSAEVEAKDVTVRVKWYARNEWMSSAPLWNWSKTPGFKPARVPGTNRLW